MLDLHTEDLVQDHIKEGIGDLVLIQVVEDTSEWNCINNK